MTNTNKYIRSTKKNKDTIHYKLSLITLFIASAFSCNNINPSTNTINETPTNTPLIEQENEHALEALNEKAKEAFSFCKSNKLDTTFCILIDMKIHSGKNRMFIYNFATKEIEKSALCAHGIGKGNNKSTASQPLFSNAEGSNLTSIGKYKIGQRSYSNWGINVHYKLHGLDESNNNAYKRIVVLHSYTPISTSEIYPRHLPLGWSQGCPVTDNETMTYLDERLQKSKKSTLLWIYYDDQQQTIED